MDFCIPKSNGESGLHISIGCHCLPCGCCLTLSVYVYDLDFENYIQIADILLVHFRKFLQKSFNPSLIMSSAKIKSCQQILLNITLWFYWKPVNSRQSMCHILWKFLSSYDTIPSMTPLRLLDHLKRKHPNTAGKRTECFKTLKQNLSCVTLLLP